MEITKEYLQQQLESARKELGLIADNYNKKLGEATALEKLIQSFDEPKEIQK